MDDAHEPSAGRIRRHLLIRGRVQGVGFRWFTHRAACARGLTGWVRNLSDGRVEIEIEGGVHQVAAFIETVGKGPAGARVDHLDEREIPLRESDAFTIR